MEFFCSLIVCEVLFVLKNKVIDESNRRNNWKSFARKNIFIEVTEEMNFERSWIETEQSLQNKQYYSQ